jgi:hypothetical protein
MKTPPKPPVRAPQPPKLTNRDHGGEGDKTPLTQLADNARRVKMRDAECRLPDKGEY